MNDLSRTLQKKFRETLEVNADYHGFRRDGLYVTGSVILCYEIFIDIMCSRYPQVRADFEEYMLDEIRYRESLIPMVDEMLARAAE